MVQKVAVCLPTRNEKENIQRMIDSLKPLGYDLFVSDENSKDGTIEIAKKNKVPVYQRDGSGKGFGVRKALKVAKQKGYDILVFIDCDQTYPVQAIPAMVRLMDTYDMVLGARKKKNIPFLHRLGNSIHTYAIRILFGGNLTDINTGLRSMKVDKFQDLTSEGFDIEAEITSKALRKRLKIKEIPIKYEERTGRSKIRLKDGWIILRRIMKESG